MTWNKDEEGLLLVLYDEGMTSKEITNVLNMRFQTDRSTKATDAKLHRLRERFNFPIRSVIKRELNAVNDSVEPILVLREKELLVKEKEPVIIKAKIDKPPLPKMNSIKEKVFSMETKPKRHNKGYTIAEDTVIISHYGVVTDEELAEHIGRSVNGVKYRYHTIVQDKRYVGRLIKSGIQIPSIDNEVTPQIKRPSWLKRWKQRRLAQRDAKARKKASVLRLKLKRLEESL